MKTRFLLQVALMYTAAFPSLASSEEALKKLIAQRYQATYIALGAKYKGYCQLQSAGSKLRIVYSFQDTSMPAPLTRVQNLVQVTEAEYENLDKLCWTIRNARLTEHGFLCERSAFLKSQNPTGNSDRLQNDGLLSDKSCELPQLFNERYAIEVPAELLQASEVSAARILSALWNQDMKKIFFEATRSKKYKKNSH